MIKKIPILIDTDIGDDIDDAFALCLAMQSPELELLGVTTVFKNTRLRAMIAQKILRLGGRGDIPVAVGTSIPLANMEMFGRELDYEELPETFSDEFAETLIEERHAVDFIIDVLEQSKDPVTIVTIGALTNIADVLRRRPDLKNKIKQMNIMGGAYERNWTEYNYACDPEAADMVLHSGILIKALGIDVTLKCALKREHLMMLQNNTHPCIQMLMKMCGKWMERGEVCLHDPLSLWTVFDESVVKFEREAFCVEHQARYSRGMCVKLSDHNWKIPPESENLYVAKTVDNERFVSECMKRLALF
jgi:purine nucleosidase/pyrimidine-specific ribonucleoside hydrolase